MPTEEEIQSILRGLDPSEIQVDADGIVRFVVAGIPVVSNVNEFDDYLRIKSSVHQSTSTSIFLPGYFEQAIEVQGRRPLFRFQAEREELSLTHEQTGFRAEIGPISSRLLMRNADSDSIDKDFRRLITMRRPSFRGRDEVSLAEAFSRILSVEVHAPEGSALRSNFKQLRAISEAMLFHIAYGYGLGVVSIQSWERSLHLLNVRRNETVQFPLRTYNHELVAYYQMAMAGESLILSYLALYKILEFFFTSASELLLHEKLKEQLVSPDFSHTKVAKLRELAKVVRKFDQRMDERRMLQTVFEQYIDRERLRLWIEKFDNENSGYFTTERDIFGESHKVDLSDNQIFPTVGSRIYHIRNALVHNKEGELARFIPFSGQEKILVNEAPLLKEISEELILRTGKDIQF
jgi:hypothetical protein